MGPTSDLGPVDPQFQNPSGPGLYSAKDLIAAVEAAERAVTNNPDTYALHASLLADVNALMVQQARSAMDRTGDLVREAGEPPRPRPKGSDEDREGDQEDTHRPTDEPRRGLRRFGRSSRRATRDRSQPRQRPVETDLAALDQVLRARAPHLRRTSCLANTWRIGHARGHAPRATPDFISGARGVWVQDICLR